jgi:hypothetical protein
MRQLKMNRSLAAFALAVGLGAGALALTAGSAQAYVVCNAHNECWHVDKRYQYREPGIVVHPDDWYFHRDWDDKSPNRWRHEEHRERGFWRNGVWITF